MRLVRLQHQLNSLYWNYGEGHHPDIDLVCKEINGYDVEYGQINRRFWRFEG